MFSTGCQTFMLNLEHLSRVKTFSLFYLRPKINALFKPILYSRKGNNIGICTAFYWIKHFNGWRLNSTWIGKKIEKGIAIFFFFSFIRHRLLAAENKSPFFRFLRYVPDYFSSFREFHNSFPVSPFSTQFPP